ncbi:hypothetical protein [Halobaculum sp. MBLA0143]|uniref:hypothetical protein n=1 Tax=Halobaculum sp. MBLA0143 TaxID=3079933 RepID=UPI0035257EBF
MSDDTYPVSLENPRSDDSVRARSVVGVDESGNVGDGVFVTVAVRAARSNGVELVRRLVENGLRPFRHKSSSLVRYSDVDKADRRRRVRALLADLSHSTATWAAVLSASPLDETAAAAMYAVAAKKAITNGLGQTRLMTDTVVLRDGQLVRGEHAQALPRQLRGHCDVSFERNICPVYLAPLEQAERTYPQVTAADYIAGSLREIAEQHGTIEAAVEQFDYEQPVRFDSSWDEPARTPSSVYRLEPIAPIREKRLKSRAIAWLAGGAITPTRDPLDRNRYRGLTDTIDDPVVSNYVTELD